jgi:sugar/nucleoside kinase (ribokinase family)
MGNKYDVVIAGDIYCDLIFTGLPRMPLPGEELYSTDFDMTAGSVFITAATLSRLGMNVGLFCHVGNDPLSAFILGELEREDIGLDLVQRHNHRIRTITAAISFAHDRSFVSFADPSPVEPRSLETLAKHDFRHLHIHWLGQLWEEPGLVTLARERGASISLDCGCCPDVMARPDVPEKVSQVDVFMPNRSEALQVTRTDDPEDALRTISRWVPTAVVKLGGEGAIAVHKGKRYTFPALSVEPLDTTGAGDAFAGGYLYGLLSGLPFEDVLKAATICGGLSVTARGGATNVPRLPQLLEWLTKF